MRLDADGFAWLGSGPGGCVADVSEYRSACSEFLKAATRQLAWLRWAQEDGLSSYLRRVYGVPMNQSVNVEQLNFFYNFVPRRDTFAATWQCAVGWESNNSEDGGYTDACDTRAPLYASLTDAILGMQMFPSRDFPQKIRDRAGASNVWHAAAKYAFTQPTKLLFPGVMVHRNADGPSGGHFGSGSYDGRHLEVGLPSHTWVEVFRVSRADDKSEDRDIAAIGQVWFWLACGSGIWLNTGKTLVQRGPPPAAEYPSCWEARRRGYDTIQLSRSFGGFVFELLDCRGADLPSSRERWEEACPPPHVELRAGLPAGRYAPAFSGAAIAQEGPCRCDATKQWLNCLGRRGARDS